jgi:outer membrane protein TolC
MTRHGLIFLCLLLLVLAGCMVGPKYTKPDVPTAPTFKETEQRQDGDGWKVAEPSDTALRGKGWELYCDARLNELEEQVDPSNQTVKEAEANLRQARAAVRFNRAAQAPTIAVAPAPRRFALPQTSPISPPLW